MRRTMVLTRVQQVIVMGMWRPRGKFNREGVNSYTSIVGSGLSLAARAAARVSSRSSSAGSRRRLLLAGSFGFWYLAGSRPAG